MLMGLMKVVTWLLSPLALGLFGVVAGMVCVTRGRPRSGWALFGFSWLWLWIWSSPWFFFALGGALERQYPSAPVSTLPVADAIVVLGGSLVSPTSDTVYPELFSGADRGWQAARCFHAGKAPVILFSGVSEGPGMKQFLMDLGVPADKILLESESRNTYENGIFTREKLKALGAKKVILVTSAWHLRRSILTFKQMGMEVIPSGCDYEALAIRSGFLPTTILYYLPSSEYISRNSYSAKEHLGYWAYWLYLHARKR